jgi:hypothetical protein
MVLIKSHVISIVAFVLMAYSSCKKEQLAADALAGNTYSITRAVLTDTTEVNIPESGYTLYFSPCENAYSATCRAFLSYSVLLADSTVQNKTDSLKYDLRSDELTFTYTQNQALFKFLLNRFSYTSLNENDITLTQTGITDNKTPIQINLTKK